MQGAPPSRFRVRRYQLAAAAAAMIVVSVIAVRVSRTAPIASHVVVTRPGERRIVSLGDGSEIALGPASRVEYRIGADRRDVTLDGLAEFTVVHDGRRPFIVRAKNAITTDLGTQFVVRAYASDTAVRVAVTSGSVSLTGNLRTPAIELRVGHVGQVSATGVARADTLAVAASETAWIDGRLRFEDATLTDIARDLARWFDADIRISSNALASRRISAVYTEPSLSGVLDALTTTIGARYERNGRVVTILPKAP
jgi:transmembrane sensor